MPRFLVASLVGAMVACGDGAEFLAWPTLPQDTESVLVALVPPESGPSLALEVHEPGVGLGPRQLTIEDSGTTRFAVLALETSPTELGLAAGPVPVASDGECLARPLPRPTVSFAVDSSAEAPLAWEERPGSAPAWLDSVAYRAPCPCGAWTLTSESSIQGEGWVEVVGDELIVFRAVSGDPGTIIFSLPEGPSFEIEDDTHFRYYASAMRADGRVFVAATNATTAPDVLELVERRELRRLEPAPFGDDVPDAMVVSEGEPLELFLLTNHGRLLRYEEGAGWAVLQDERLVLGEGGGRQSRSILALSRGEIIASVHNSSSILRVYSDGRTEIYVAPLTEFVSAVRVFGHSPRLGIIAASYGGALAKVESNELWTRLPDPGLGRINQLSTHEDGLLMAGDVGWAELHPEAGTCAVGRVARNAPYEGFRRWRENLVAWTRDERTQTTRIEIYTPAN